MPPKKRYTQSKLTKQNSQNSQNSLFNTELKEEIVKHSYVGSKGYSIPLSILNDKQIKQIQDDLTAKPFAPKTAMSKPKTFPIYRMSSKKIYVPRYYGFDMFGVPASKLPPGEDIQVEFNGSMRQYQIDIVNSYKTKAVQKNGCGLLEIPCGRGKCLAKGTPIMMYDDSIKKVEDVKDGDLVMGDDYKPRFVWGTTSGNSIMYLIQQEVEDKFDRKYINAKEYCVNSEHILTLYNTVTKCIEDINIQEIIMMMRETSKSVVLEKYRGIMSVKLYGKIKTIYTRLNNITQQPIGEYYGFCIDGNRRFLLGDKTVTHNTVMALNIISVLQKKTLVIVHKEFLLNQWIERIEQFLPTAKVGRIQGKIIDVEGKDIVIGMLQSLSMKDYDNTLFQQFGLTIIDETHHISAEVFCRSLFKIVSPYMLGLSATMNRKDGLTSVFKKFLGPIVHSEQRKDEMPVNVKIVQYEVNDDEFNETLYNFKGQTHYALMIRKLCEYKHRSELILFMLKEALEYSKTLTDDGEPQQIMILAHNKSLLKYLHDAIKERNMASVGYYVGGMKEKQLKETEEKTVVIATYAMAEEALDIKTLSGLILATPKTDVTQAVGRILRMKHKNPFVIDFVDVHDVFQKQFLKRRAFYRKCNYVMHEASSADYIKAQSNKCKGDIPYFSYNDETIWKMLKMRTRKSNKKQDICDDSDNSNSNNNQTQNNVVQTPMRTKKEQLIKGKCLFGKAIREECKKEPDVKNNIYAM